MLHLGRRRRTRPGAIGVPIERRLAYLRELRPDVAALNMGSMNYAKWSARRHEFVFSTVFETIMTFVKEMGELGLEDNFYLPDGSMARSNGELVARARRLTEDVGRRVAGVPEARERLGVAS
ncbi:MAG: 3-keto-5-aminohexanoate cleavage protein [Solirubrobacterales bacterium]|nr:3-keto-5-aminohexanoate cleavage protein [Solirubrobacterales bacterium]